MDQCAASLKFRSSFLSVLDNKVLHFISVSIYPAQKLPEDLGAVSLKLRSYFVSAKFTSLIDEFPPKRFSETAPWMMKKLVGI